MSAIDRPYVGMRFIHARQIVETPGVPCREWPHETCIVTAVRRGVVYYRNSTGFLTSTPVDRFADSVGE